MKLKQINDNSNNNIYIPLSANFFSLCGLLIVEIKQYVFKKSFVKPNSRYRWEMFGKRCENISSSKKIYKKRLIESAINFPSLQK